MTTRASIPKITFLLSFLNILDNLFIVCYICYDRVDADPQVISPGLSILQLFTNLGLFY